MIIFTSEYVYNNIKLNEKRKILENTLREHELKYGAIHHRNVEVKCVAEFLDKKKTKENL